MSKTASRLSSPISHHHVSMRLLHHIGLISAQRDRAALELHFVEAIRELLHAKRTCLYKLFSPKGNNLVGLAAEADAEHSEVLDDGVSWPPGTASLHQFPVLKRCFLTNQHLQEKLASLRSTAHVFPLQRGTLPHFGFLVIELSGSLSADNEQIVEGLITLLCNHHALLDYSEMDTLTGLLNRKTFDDSLLRILNSLQLAANLPNVVPLQPQRRQVHAQQTHWLGVVDVDHFKRINDTYGHLIGDEILIEVAQMMRNAFRANDKFFRFGGEEFVVLLQPTDIRSARAVLERFRHTVESKKFPLVGHVTVSIGFTRINSSDQPSVVIDNADEAMYWVKAHGRNQVCCYEELLAEGQATLRDTWLQQRELAARLAAQALLPN